ncbi:integrase domain-containing protein [Orbus mooreae]|uniref:integrase domain-containing protein n=1 Tax=Orbus mooreae TaxID=3074107 RepID=UPI00370D731F
MAIKIPPLTDTQIKSFKPIDKDKKYFDGGGLFLLVKVNGVKSWRLKYNSPLTKKEKLLTFGNYPDISLQQARKLRDKARELIKQGVDPQEHKKELEQKKQLEIDNSFYAIALQWKDFKVKQGIHDRTIALAWGMLNNHLFPYIKDIPINQITAVKVINALQPLHESNKLETVKQVCSRANEIMYYAVNKGIIDNNPIAKVTAVFSKPKSKSRPTIKPDELPDFMKALSMANIELQTKLVIEWQLLTLTRPSEAVGAKWEEIDLKANLWTIPSERMKMDRAHAIPLSKQAMRILEVMKHISARSEYVFPSIKPPYNQPMNSQTANMAIKRMGYKDKLVAHGLRALASTALNEQGFNYDVIESALSHVDKNAVRRAYNRAEYEQQKRVMLDWWGDFVEQASNGNVSISGTKSFKVING